jgi:hypothetical protein
LEAGGGELGQRVPFSWPTNVPLRVTYPRSSKYTVLLPACGPLSLVMVGPPPKVAVAVLVPSPLFSVSIIGKWISPPRANAR